MVVFGVKVKQKLNVKKMVRLTVILRSEFNFNDWAVYSFDI